MINFQFVRTSVVKTALGIVSKDAKAAFIAGGTNLVDLMKRGVTAPEKLIDINYLPLKNIELINNVLHVGALASNSALAENVIVKEKFPLLMLALQAGASAQLRNVATVGGNMMQRTRCGYFYDTTMPCNKRVPGSGCGAIGGYNRMHAIFGTSESCIAVHPSDMCVGLVALDAKVVIAGIKGERKIDFVDFHRLPGDTPHIESALQHGEIITAVTLPKPMGGLHVYRKVRDRASYAFALVSVAAVVQRDGSGRIAVGGVAHKPWRSESAESKLSQGAKAVSADLFANANTTHDNAFKVTLAERSIASILTQAKQANQARA